MAEIDGHGSDEPTGEEIAAALAAVRLLLRRRGGRGTGASRWLRTARAEAVAPPAQPATWHTAERPQ